MIVNTSSVFGLVGMPAQSAYCASKFAVRGFTDSLRQELRGSGVDAVTVHPGGIKTNILRNARYHSHPTQPDLSHEEANRQFDAIAFTTPERAAKVIHDGVKRGGAGSWSGPTPTSSMPWRVWRRLATSTSSRRWSRWPPGAGQAPAEPAGQRGAAASGLVVRSSEAPLGQDGPRGLAGDIDRREAGNHGRQGEAAAAVRCPAGRGGRSR